MGEAASLREALAAAKIHMQELEVGGRWGLGLHMMHEPPQRKLAG